MKALFCLLDFSILVLSVPTTQSSTINGLLADLANLPGLNDSISDMFLTTLESDLAAADDIQTTQNGLSNGICTAMTVIFARGTTEPGNVGVLTAPFFDALESMLGTGEVTVQRVDYPASIEGFLEGGDPTGSQTMATLIQTATNQCPDTKLVMSGYSQGGQLVHTAAKLLPAATMAAVSSVVIFGDPDDGEAVTNAAASKVLVICHVGDDICARGDLVFIPHLTYSENAEDAALFVVAESGLGLGN